MTGWSRPGERPLGHICHSRGKLRARAFLSDPVSCSDKFEGGVREPTLSGKACTDDLSEPRYRFGADLAVREMSGSS